MSNKPNQLTLFIPSLLNPAVPVSQLKPSDIPALDSLSLILSRASINKLTSKDFLTRCFELLHILPADTKPPCDLPLGPILYSLIENNLKPSGKNWIYKLSPVFLYPDMDQLILANDLSEDIQVSEAEKICQAINEYFNQSEQDNTWQLTNIKQQLFLLCKRQNPIQTTPLDYVLGKPLSQYLPTGDEAAYWNQTLNEIQMLLFTLPFNKTRQERGKVAINSLWPWGGGEFPPHGHSDQSTLWTDSRVKVFTENPRVKQLCQFKNIDTEPLSSFADYTHNHAENYLAITDDCDLAYINRDVYSWLEHLQHYEEKLFKPALSALKQKQIYQINIITADHQYFSITRRQVQSWWKWKKDFSYFLQ